MNEQVRATVIAKGGLKKKHLIVTQIERCFDGLKIDAKESVSVLGQITSRKISTT